MTYRNSLAGPLRLGALLALLAGLLAGCLGPEPTPTPLAPTATTAANPTDTVAAQPTNTAATTDAATPTTVVLDTATPVAAGTTPTRVAGGETVTPVSRAPAVRFANYNYQPSTVQPAVPAYTVQPGLANVTNAGDFTFSSAQKIALEQNAFVVVPPRNVQISEIQWVYRQFFQLYEDGRYENTPVFVSSDSVLHVYHLMFDKLLRSTETKSLSKDAQALTQAMLTAAQAQYDALKGTPGEAAALRNVAYFAVAAKLLDPAFAVPAAVNDMVTNELALIEAHEGVADSNIFPDYKQDYSQFVPRGHYTRSEDLSRYFKAMMWYGQMPFSVKDASTTQSALLLTAALQNDPQAKALWERIYDTTGFFVGAADDLTYRDYAALMQQVYGSTTDPAALLDPAKVAQFQELAAGLPDPRVGLSEPKGLRFMGQRFTIDAYVLDQLIWDKVGTVEKKRLLPKGLDVPAAMGSTEASGILWQEGETGYANYTDQLEKMRKELAALPQEQWTANVYWSWLYTLFPLLQPHDADGYPTFMRSSAWNRKQLNTVLGSWTELKHDTILYAKQAMAEGAGGPPERVKGYVEPYPDFYGRVAALIGMTRDGLQARGLLDAEMQDPLDRLAEVATSLKTISEKELRNEDLTDEEYDLIQFYGATIEHLTESTWDMDFENGSAALDQDSALVADVATGGDQVLEEGTGHPTAIYVVVPIDDALVITRGGVYSHYEFTVPPAERMTDETWRQRLDANQAPPLPAWTEMFLKP